MSYENTENTEYETQNENKSIEIIKNEPCADCKVRSELDNCRHGCEILARNEPVFQSMDIDLLHPDPSQPRKTFTDEKLKGLAETLKTQGMLQPMVVDEDGRIVLGERRWRAAKLAGLKQVPVIVRHTNDPLLCQLIADAHSEEIPIFEKVKAWHTYREQNNLSVETLADLLGLSRWYTHLLLGLIGMPKAMEDALKANKISATDLAEIRTLPEEEQMDTLRLCIDRQRSREEMRKLIKAKKQKLISEVRRPSRKPEEEYFNDSENRPKDVLRRIGVDNVHQNVVVASNHETTKHFVVKALIYKLLRAMGRITMCEMEAGTGVVDIFDTETRYAYEVESDPGPNTAREKVKQFANRVRDVLIINLNKVPDDLVAMETYLKTRIV